MAQPPLRAQNEAFAETRKRTRALPASAPRSGTSSRGKCAALSADLDLPEAVTDHGDPPALGVDARGLEVGAADHHVQVDGGLVDTARGLLRPGPSESGSERDMGGRVLVEQRLVVRTPTLSDARRGVDERDLAQPSPVSGLVAVEVARHEVAVVGVLRLEADEPAAAELAAQPFDQAPLEREREPARERTLGRGCVRARERLLGRDVRGGHRAVRRPLLAAEPRRPRSEADVELGTRPAQLDPRQREARELLRALCDRPAVRDPAGRSRAVLVGEPAEPEEVLRELPLRLQHRHSGIHALRPVVGRPAHERPAHAQAEARPPKRLRLLAHARVLRLDPLRRDPVEEARLTFADDVDLGRVRLRQLAQTTPIASSRPFTRRARMTSGSDVTTSTRCAPPRYAEAAIATISSRCAGAPRTTIVSPRSSAIDFVMASAYRSSSAGSRMAPSSTFRTLTRLRWWFG